MKRIREVVVQIPFNHHEAGVTVILRRYGGHERIVKDGDRVSTILGVLSNGAWTSQISTTDNWIAGAWKYCRVQSITYKPMQYAERGYREVLRYIFQWLSENVDGKLEDDDNASRYWHMLGSMFPDGKYWSQAQHREQLMHYVGDPEPWNVFFRTKGR